MRLSIQSADVAGARWRRLPSLGVLLLGLTVACAKETAPGGSGGSGGTATGSGGDGNAGTGGSPIGGTSGGGPAGSVGTGGSVGNAGTGGSVGTTGTAGTSGNAGTTGNAGAGGRAGTGGRAGSAGGTAGGGGAGGGVASGCAGKTYKLCEDFETGTVGSIPTGWTALNGFGSDSMKGVGLATDQWHSGSKALKSQSMVPGEERIQKSLAALGATATKHWGRIFYRVQSPAPRPASGAVIHVTFAALEGTTENRVVDTVEASNGTHQFLYNVPDDSCCSGSAYSWSFDANWHCAEWYVDVAAQSYRFFTDSTEVTSLAFTANANAKMSSYTALAVGAQFFQAPPTPFVIWFDDLAIDDNQIGCQ
jgi:hypothetical protein